MASEKAHRVHPVIRDRARELRRTQTPAEKRLWANLRDRQLGGFKFRRQYPIGRFVVDFYCASRRLVIEVDGDSHAEQVAYDSARSEWLGGRGYRVVRFSNREVDRELDAVLEAILVECRQ
jgi:very-short-patch-repair endonuclease